MTLIDIPARNILNVKNLFTVCDCKMHWQKSGDYLCVKVDRYRSKKEEKDGQLKYSVRFFLCFMGFLIDRFRENAVSFLEDNQANIFTEFYGNFIFYGKAVALFLTFVR